MSNPQHSPLRISTNAFVTMHDQARWRSGKAPQKIEVRTLTPTIGAEIFGVDLKKPLPADVLAEMWAALHDHLVIFFRDQDLTPDEFKTFGQQFGPLTRHPFQPVRVEGHPEIFVAETNENSENATGEEWHSDLSYEPEPALGSILYMKELPANGGGDTMFANMYTAYETLSAPMKQLLEGLTAVHDSSGPFRGRYKGVALNREYPCTEHPLIRTHPVTGAKLLYVNRVFTTHIPQLRRHESNALLEMLYRHIETSEFHCRFKWQVGSIAFWDNRSTQHHALWDYFPQRRYAHRLTIAGDKPFYRP